MTTGLPPYVILGGIKSFYKSASSPENKQKNRKEKKVLSKLFTNAQ